MVHRSRVRTSYGEDDDVGNCTVNRKVGIIAALPREVKALVKGWELREPSPNVRVWTKGNAVVACAGMGGVRAAVAVDAAMAAMPVTDLISAGLAGACDPTLKVGDIIWAGVVIDQATGERFNNSQFKHVLVSTDEIVSVREKARLHASCYSSAVDMEAAAVARIAAERGLNFQAIKVISDEVDFEIEGLSRFATADGQFREGAFALHAALRPAMWGKMIALGKNSGIALRALTQELRGKLDWYEKRS
jgi:adenosylhomocysteine nucleosidase